MDRDELAEKILFLTTEDLTPEQLQERAELECESYYGKEVEDGM